MPDCYSYWKDHRQRFESDLFEWLRIPSIGTDSSFDRQTREAAEWLAQKFRELDLQTELIETVGHPLVYAESPRIPGAPTVLIYGHYDVQPPDPLELWETPPFEPAIRDGKVFARGATDNKGQMITHLFGVETYLKTHGKLPVIVKFLVEGEEESGGAGLKAFLRGEYDDQVPVREKLSADIALISDCSQYAAGQPAITHGLRGTVYFEMTLTGPDRDLHSGEFGGTVTNPANTICQMLSAVMDDDGRIQIPGFYDDVEDLSEQEIQQLAELDFSDAEYRQDLGVAELAGEKGYSTLQRRWCRPTFDVHGLWSGYQGAGAKTVLPSSAGVKFSCRLVPRQDPEKIKASLRQLFKDLCPPGIQMDVVASHGAPGFVLSLESPFMAAAERAIEQGFGRKPVYIRSGGSIPVVNSFTTLLGIDTLLLGWGQNDDNLHSPNEKFSLADFHRGIQSSYFLLEEIGRLKD